MKYIELTIYFVSSGKDIGLCSIGWIKNSANIYIKKTIHAYISKTNYLVNNSPFQPNLFEICLTLNITNMCNILFFCPYHSRYLETLALIILFVKMLKILNNWIFWTKIHNIWKYSRIYFSHVIIQIYQLFHIHVLNLPLYWYI
jgi:hypothetical protein